MPQPDRAAGSALLLDEYFDGEDGRFLEQLRAVGDAQRLAGFADRWKKDPRPWARRQLLAWLDQPFDAPGHHPLVKRLFKHAEQAHDHELMAAFLVAFDRLVRRVRKKRYRYDWQTRSAQTDEVLHTPADVIVAAGTARTFRNPMTGASLSRPVHVPRNGRLFTYRTRYHLRRRAWRYFRRLGFQHPADYAAAVARALCRYRDADLARGENLLDSWGLLHACFGASAALVFRTSRAALRDGRTLADLAAAPRFPDLWRRAEALPVLLGLVVAAEARPVRVWAMELLRRDHAARLAACPPADLMRLLDHADGEVQQFGAELFRGAAGIEKLPVATWLKLLETRNPTALALLCEAMARHVTPDRLDLGQCVELACAQPTPVARMGLAFLSARALAAPDQLRAVAGLAEARCVAVAGAAADWALGLLGAPGAYDRNLVIRFFDSLAEPTRASAWRWLTAAPVRSPGYDDPELWRRLLETPYDDLRLRIVDLLGTRARLPGTGPGDLAPLWSAVLLGVHRGGRQKAKAVRQVADALAADPSRADVLLPVLAAAVRSVRAPEARAGLAAVVAAVAARPELAAAVRRTLPELDLAPPAEGTR